ncbi:hypothetical protein Esti_005364 [Eimeria stiedai]
MENSRRPQASFRSVYKKALLVCVSPLRWAWRRGFFCFLPSPSKPEEHHFSPISRITFLSLKAQQEQQQQQAAATGAAAGWKSPRGSSGRGLTAAAAAAAAASAAVPSPLPLHGLVMETFKRRPEGGPQGAAPYASAASGSVGPAAGYGALPAGAAAAAGLLTKRQRVSQGPLGGEGEQQQQQQQQAGAAAGAAADLGGGGGGGGPSSTARGRVLPVCLLVSENIAGALIGKGGNTVREFERSTNSKILIQRNTLGAPELAVAQHAAAETAGLPLQAVEVEKVVAVTGTKEEEVQGGVSRVLGLISSHPGQQHVGRSLALLLVPQRSVGGIVGQRGRTVEELSQRAEAQIRVIPGIASPNGDRALCITAQEDGPVVHAIQLVQQQLQQMLSSGRLQQQDFEFLISLASVPQPKALRGVNKGLPGAGGGAPGAAMGAPGMAPPGGFYGPGMGWGAPGGGPEAGGVGGGGPLVGMGTQGGPGVPAAGMSGYRFVSSVEAYGGLCCSSVLCIVIPQRLAPWIVGPQGAHVRAVKEETGVKMQVVDSVQGFTSEDSRRIAMGAQGGPQQQQGVPSPAEVAVEGNDRFCMISGGVQCLCAAILRLGVPLHDKLHQLKQPLRLLVPARFVACLIGTKGLVIREIQANSGAVIRVSRSVGNGAGGGESAGVGEAGSGASGGNARGGSGAPRDQHRIVFIEGPLPARLVALALVWQRILSAEYPDLSKGGASFFCVSSLVADLQQLGHDVSMVRIPAAAPMQQQQQHQQQPPPYGPDDGSHPPPYYDGAPAAGMVSPSGWGAPPPDPMGGVGGMGPGGPPQGMPWGGQEGGWGAGTPPKEGPPSFEDMEGYFRSFCSRFLQPQELAVCGERQTIKMLLSLAQGEALLRREQQPGRFGTAPAPNALDKISELTGCHVRCFVTEEPVPHGAPSSHGGPPQMQQQMVLVFTGSPVANSLAVMLTQARLVQC